MKTGVILYVTGDHRDSNLDDIIQTGRKMHSADRVEVVSANSGHHDIDYAWWTLTARGMHKIVCSFVKINNNGSVRFSEKDFRLCG